MDVVPGLYQHYKGKVYEVIGVAKHSETLEEFVVYKEQGKSAFWIRPKSLFLENITVKDIKVPRFTHIRTNIAFTKTKL
jgi:cyclomaltodextrinase / maltogenic alpha-amylase / neopullulanase